MTLQKHFTSNRPHFLFIFRSNDSLAGNMKGRAARHFKKKGSNLSTVGNLFL